MTQSLFQRFSKRCLPIWQKYCHKNLPPPPNNYGIDSVINFYKNVNITTNFQLKPTTKDIALELLKILIFPKQ